MDDAIKVVDVLDESDNDGSGVNNNIQYDGVDGRTLTTIIMDEESMVRKTLPPPFFPSLCCLCW